VKLWDALLGRRRPATADLDALFALPTAVITLQTGLDFRPTGAGSVCYRPAEGVAFAQTQADVVELLDADDGPAVEESHDDYGYSWLLVRHDPSDVSGLVTDLHAVNTTLEARGFGPGLLCSLVGFKDTTGRRLAVVYLYKQGTFYPFVPLPGQRRDNLVEIQVRDLVGADLPWEQSLQRWMPVWGAPGL